MRDVQRYGSFRAAEFAPQTTRASRGGARATLDRKGSTPPPRSAPAAGCPGRRSSGGGSNGCLANEVNRRAVEDYPLRAAAGRHAHACQR
jgi:hypothetical protein